MKKALIADDSSFARLILKVQLEKMGMQVLEASNGVIALQRVQQEKPDYVFMDVVMPEMDGISAVKEIKKIKEEKNIETPKIIMYTAQGDRRKVVESIKNGAIDYILKPIEKERLELALRK